MNPALSARQQPSFRRPREPRQANEFPADQLDELVRLHSPYVAGLAYRLLGRDSDVDDIVQEVFVALLRFHHSVRDPDALRGWLATTTTRLSHRRMRSIAFRVRSWFSPDDEVSDALASGASADDHLALAQVHRALARVAPSARVAWILRYVEQERMEDVARITGCSLSTAKRRVEVAQTAVKRALGDD